MSAVTDVLRSTKEKGSKAILLFKDIEIAKAMLACGFLAFTLMATAYSLRVLSARHAAVLCILYALILAGAFLTLRSAHSVMANAFLGAVASIVCLTAPAGWLIRDVYEHGGSGRREGNLVLNPKAWEAIGYCVRHPSPLAIISLLLPFLALFAGFLIFRGVDSRTRRIQFVTGALLVPFGLGPGLQQRIVVFQPLQDFCRLIVDQRADVRFTQQHVAAAEYPAAGKRTFPSKRWVHRTNTIEKLNTLFPNFVGFELDVVFHAEGKYFDVTHPPAPSIGLTLDAYFASQSAIGTKYFWLDFKNLSDENADSALRSLKATANRYKLQDHLVVESGRADLLTRFTRAGFYTSFYLPQKGGRTEAEWLEEISSKLARARVDAISTDEGQYRLIRDKHFFDYDVLVWNLEDMAADEADPRIKVLLIDQHTPFER